MEIMQEAGFQNAVSPQAEKGIQKYFLKFYTVLWDSTLNLISLNFHAILVIISLHKDFNRFEILGHFSPNPQNANMQKLDSASMFQNAACSLFT